MDMHMFRTSLLLARLILAWFVLTVGVAIASTIIHPPSLELVCSTGGTAKLVQMDAFDGESGATDVRHHHTLDCPACLHLTAPPPPDYPGLNNRQQALAHALQPTLAAIIAALVGAPLPPRGPPELAS